MGHQKTRVDILTFILTVFGITYGLCLETPELPLLDGLLYR